MNKTEHQMKNLAQHVGLQRREQIVLRNTHSGQNITVSGIRQALAFLDGKHYKTGKRAFDIVSVDGRNLDAQATGVGHAFIGHWQHRGEYINLATQQMGLAPTLFEFNMDKAKQAW